jgi:hypothetical protein
MNRIRAVVLAALILALITLGTPATRAAGISIIESNAAAQFPAGITFDVKATSDSPVIKVELLYSNAEDETMNLVAAPMEPSNDIDVSLPVSFQVNYVAPGVELTYHWRLTDANGSIVETEPAKVTLTDTRFDWKEFSSDQVKVYTYNGNDEFSQFILDTAQSTVTKLESEFGVSHSRPISIWAYDTKSDFLDSQAPNSEEWNAATAFPEWQIITAILPDGDEREVGRVVPHEISHQILYQATKNPFNAPTTWLDEGLAVSAQSSGNEGFQEMVARAAQDERLFSLRSLTNDYPYDPADVSLAYAEYYSAVQFIITTWGEEGIAAIISAYQGGNSHDDVLKMALGVNMDELDAMWKESLGNQGNRGVAGATSHSGGGWTDNLIVNASSLLLLFLAAVSGIVLVIRKVRGRPDANTMHALGA